MPVMSNPAPWLSPENASVFDSPVTKGLRAAGKLIGADDPNQIMGIAGTGLVAPEAEGLVGWLGSKLHGLLRPGAANAAAEASGSSFKPAVTQLGKLAVPSIERARPAMQTLGEALPDFTPVGGEGMFNAARGAGRVGPNPEQIYQNLLGKLGGKAR